jgi:hypothetical protein
LKRFAYLLVLATTAALASAYDYAAPAFAHDFGADAVRPTPGGGELVVLDETRYDAELNNAIARWQAFDCLWAKNGDRCGGVHVFRSTDYGGAYPPTVRVYDYCEPNTTVGGTFTYRSSLSTISLNSCSLDGWTSQQRHWLVLHEFGHALGFAHVPCTRAWASYSVMIPSTSCAKNNAPSSSPLYHDATDYHQAYIVGNRGSAAGAETAAAEEMSIDARR